MCFTTAHDQARREQAVRVAEMLEEAAWSLSVASDVKQRSWRVHWL